MERIFVLTIICLYFIRVGVLQPVFTIVNNEYRATHGYSQSLDVMNPEVAALCDNMMQAYVEDTGLDIHTNNGSDPHYSGQITGCILKHT